MKAFGQIIKSLFILRYIDDLTLRQAIERQLNKVELANRFTRAVAVGNPREFTQVEKEEQEVAEACNRLIKNSIICWNYLYLTRRVEKAPDTETRKNLLRLIASHSPMSWAHINLHSPSGVSFEVKIAYIRALDKDFLPQAALAVAQTAGSGRIRPRSRCFLAQGRRFSAQRTDLSSRFRSV